ncbi:hypothetical protein M9Y10_013702 [Tritrichomonas musculus]|uniref:Lipid-binding serum glycoprotein C-terminal domain-containing protein n=1 Tax=Tritrichomonas musculus TaxID=1915356 RepID=A0ABR2KZF9_9EUKA
MNALNLLLTLGTIPFLKKNDATCDFDCWVRSLVIHVPPIYYQISSVESINITNMIVKDMSITTMNASFYPNEDKIDDGLLLNVTLSANIGSDFHFKGVFINLLGNFSVSASNVNIQLPLKFIKDSDGLISNISLYDDKKCFVAVDNIAVNITTDSPILDPLIKLLTDVIISIVKSQATSLVCNSIKPALSEYGSAFFAKLNGYIRPYINGSSPIDIPIDPEKMSDLRESQVIDLLRFVLSNLTTSEGLLNINNLVNRFSRDTGIFDYQDIADLFGLSPHLSFDIPVNNENVNSTIKFTLIDLVLSNLNTWKDFSFLNPISPFVLDTHTSLEKFGINLTFEINVSIEGLVDTGEVELSETAFLHMDMENNSMDFLLQYAAEKGIGLNYTTAQCYDPSCLIKLASPEGTGFKMFEFDTSFGLIDLEAAEATIEEYIQKTINTLCDFFIFNYRNQIPVFLNGFINEFGTSFINSAINDTLRTTECENIQDPPYTPFSVLMTWVGFGFFVFGCIVLCSLTAIAHYLRKRKEQIRQESLATSGAVDTLSISTSDDESAANTISKPLLDDESQGKFLSFFRIDSNSSLFMHPKLPLWVRLLMPILICSNISVFLSSNGSYGGSVFLKMHFGDYKKLEFPSMFDFSLINSIRDMWKAGTYALSILVAIMSCIWPYTKLILMLIVWMIPSTILRKKHRDRILRILDELGKWSLLDSYFMILMVVGFHFVIDFPIVGDKTITKSNILYVWVYPAYGFIGLIGGTLYSLALSHIICYIDRYASNPSDNKIDTDPASQVKISVFHEQNLPSKIFLAIFLPFALALFITGIAVRSFSFEFVGFTGWALDVLGIQNKMGYTVIDMVTMFPKSCEFPNNWEVRAIQVVYVITAIITPMLHIIALGFMLYFPMTKKHLFSMYNFCEVLYAWSCLDVFTLSLLVSMVQITQFTNFMVGHNCDLINDILRKFFTHDKYIDGHYKCFEVLTVLENGTFLLIAAAIINTVAALWINRVTRKVIEKDQDSGDYVPVADKPEILLYSENYTIPNES